MKGCDHDVIYSGQTNLERKFAYICRKCGEIGWDSRYVMSRVNFDEYCRQRVIHGWASPNPIYAPGGAWRRVQQARISEAARLARRHWRLPLIANALALVATSAVYLWVQPRPLLALFGLPVFASLVGLSWWKVLRG